MSKTYEIIDRVGISNESLSDAIKSLVLEANRERKVSWFEVLEQRGRIVSDNELEFQVSVRLGRKLD